MKRKATSFAKITRPKAEGILPRKRLFRLLDQAQQHPVLWVSGPPGSGKTSLIASYLDFSKLPCLWYQFDESDSDIASFFFYLGLGAKKASPRFRKPLPLLRPEYLMGIPVFTLKFFENLYSRLNLPSPPLGERGIRGKFDNERLTTQFVLVFDDYHRVTSDSLLHEVIFNGISALPEGVKFILISRTNPPAVFARLHAHGQMGFLGWNELRFTLEESKKIVGLWTRGLLSKETIEHFHQTTNGWVAGLILISDALKKGIEIHSFEKSSPEAIFNYFESELFLKMDEATRAFLMKTAFLPGMTVQMAETLSGVRNGEVILTSLIRNNYFIEKHHSAEPVYQYHPLFRNFLLSQAKESFPRKVLSDLNHRAALLLEESGQAEDAVQIYKDQRNWEALARLIMKEAPSMLAQGRNQLLENWLTHLPKNSVEKSSWLLFWLGSCHFPKDPSRSQEYLEKALELFCEERNEEGTFLSWSGIVNAITFSHSTLSRLDRWIHKLEDLMHDFKEFPSQEIGARVASGMVAALTLRKPQHPEFHKWAGQALSFTESPQRIGIRVWVLFHLVTYNLWMGKSESGTAAQKILSQLIGSRDLPPFFKIIGKLADSIYYQFTGSHEKCMEAVYEGMELSRTSGIHILDQLFLGHAISSSLNVNDHKKARLFLDRLASTLSHSPPSDVFFDIRNESIYHRASARYALACGEIADLAFHDDLALKYGIKTGAPLIMAMYNLTSAIARHRLGKNEEAMDQLRKGSLIANETKSKTLEFGSLLIQSYFFFERGDETSGLQFLKTALALGKNLGLLNTHFDDPSMTARLCAKALEAGIDVEYVREIIRKRHLIPDKESLQPEHWPWPLKIYSLGRFAIHKDGTPLPPQRKGHQRPHEMLKALVALGGRGIREEEISDILWPEADGDAAHHSFETTLHRLRTLIGCPEVLQLHEGRLTLDPKYCWVDAWAFERLLGVVDGRGWAKNSISLAQKAMRLYRGTFLAEETGKPWLISMRERLRSKFLRSVNRLGDCWCQAEQWEKALECYQKGLEVDDLAEEFYQGVMCCYQHLGREANALATYHRFEKRLKMVLGIKPSSKTKALRDTLLKKNAQRIE